MLQTPTRTGQFAIQQRAAWRILAALCDASTERIAMDLTKYQALSFDCYGTLIDWEAGVLGVLRPWTTECGLEVDDDDLLRAYGDHESAAEREQPMALYPAIVAEAFRRMGRSLGVAVDET